MMKKTFMYFTILFLTFNLSFAQTKEEKKKKKEETEIKEYETIKSLIEFGTYFFTADWTTTQKGKRINLATNFGYLKIDNENAEADLPYFGVAQVASYSTNGGIVFNNENVTYKVEFDDKKQKVIIQFNATQKSESFNLILSVFKSGSASLTISSNKRNSARYDGKVTEIKDPK
jgi:hypothetical protein